MSTIMLQSCDGEVFHVDKTIAMKLKTVKTLLEDLGDEDDEVIPLPNVSSVSPDGDDTSVITG